MSIEWILGYLAIGAIVGVLAGLLGIGGGGIIVPILTAMFAAQDFPEEQIVHLALGTAMATIVITAISSIRAHHRHHAILWPAVKRIVPGVLVGTFGATFLAARLSSQALSIIFACFMGYVSLNMILNLKPMPQRQLPGPTACGIVGAAIGGLSALVAVGGGALTTTFLMWCNISVRQAIATSATVGLPIAIAGTLGYIINGWGAPALPANSVGYVYLPAFVLITCTSALTAPLGARLTHTLPIGVVKRIFAVLVLALAVKMVYTVFTAN